MLRSGGGHHHGVPVGVTSSLGAEFLAERKIQGSRMGSNQFRVDMPRFVDFYLSGSCTSTI